MRNKDKYPEAWFDCIRPDILKRDKFTCKKCGIKHRSYVYSDKNNDWTPIDLKLYVDWKQLGKKVFRIYLQVAHIDNNPANCDYSNLIAICPKCHLNMDKDFRALMRKANKSAIIQSIGATEIPPRKTQPH